MGPPLARLPTATQGNCFHSLVLATTRLALAVCVNEILRKVGRKLNTFLETEARNLESSEQKPLHCFWNSALAWPLGHGAITRKLLPDISGVLMFTGPPFFF